MKILVLMEQVEQGWGIEPLVLVVHSIFEWEMVQKMWAFASHTTV